MPHWKINFLSASGVRWLSAVRARRISPVRYFLTEWLSRSGGTGETPSQLCTISGKSRLRGAAEPLSDWSRCWAVAWVRSHRKPRLVIGSLLILVVAAG